LRSCGRELELPVLLLVEPVADAVEEAAVELAPVPVVAVVVAVAAPAVVAVVAAVVVAAEAPEVLDELAGLSSTN
jgi:hypothetical protein